MTALRRHLVLAAFGLAVGFVLSAAGFSDPAELRRMFTFGLLEGGPSLASLRLVLAFAGAVAVAALGFFLLARRDALPRRTIDRGTVPGALLFGAGWALCGACPAVALVQIGEGKLAAAVTLAGMLAGARGYREIQRRRRWASRSCSGD